MYRTLYTYIQILTMYSCYYGAHNVTNITVHTTYIQFMYRTLYTYIQILTMYSCYYGAHNVTNITVHTTYIQLRYNDTFNISFSTIFS